MDAPDPAARTALSVIQIDDQTLDVLVSRFFFFHKRHPADPFVARERRQAFPCRKS